MTKNIQTSVLLASHLFKPLNEEQLEEVRSAAKVINLTDREQLFQQGDLAEYFYLVVSGNIKLFRRSEEGNEKIVEIIQPGHTFAEAVMFMEFNRYPVNATAIGGSVLYRFNNKVYLQLLEESKELCFALFANLSLRLHELVNEIETVTLFNARLRVVQYLMNIVDVANSDKINLEIDKKIIASRLSITPETLSRIFRELADINALSVSNKSITILDVEKLQHHGKSPH